MIAFPSMNFSGMNEADIRAEVIDPLIRYLGYQSGTEFNVERERTLRWPRISLGRKKKTDPQLKGRPDYVLEVTGVGRWTIEAKPPNEDISIDDIEQAYTYAVHPEVAASFFVICNGRRFVVFRTSKGPKDGLLFELMYEEIEAKLQLLANVLGPDSFRRAMISEQIDVGMPLARGLPSTLQIVAGYVEYEESRASLPQVEDSLKNFDGRRLSIERGFVWRMDNQIAVKVEQGFFHSLHEVAQAELGVKEFTYLSSDQVLSRDPAKPNIFESKNRFEFKKGMRLFDLTTMQLRETPCDATFIAQTEVIGSLEEREFRGRFFGSATMQLHPAQFFPRIDFEMTGKIKLRWAD